MPYSHELSLLFLMEGLSIPLIRGQLNFDMNRPATATFDLPPLREINKVRARTLCQLFVRDFTTPGDPLVLAYEGEVLGMGMAKNPSGQRAFRVMTADFSSYWQNATLLFMNAIFAKGMPGLLQFFKKDETKKQINTVLSNDLYMITKMQEYISAHSGDKDVFFGALVNLLKGPFGNINAFYQGNSERLRLIDRLLAESTGNTGDIFRYQKALQMMHNQISGFGGETTVLNCLQRIMGMIYHNTVTSPFPSYLKNRVLPGELSGRDVIGQFLFKPDAYMLPPPKCNVVFPNQYTKFNFDRNFMQEPTRLMFQPLNPILKKDTILKHTYVAPQFMDRYYNGEEYEDDTDFGSMMSLDMQAGRDAYFATDINSKSRETEAVSNAEVMKGHVSAYVGEIEGAVYLLANDSKGELSKDKTFKEIGKEIGLSESQVSRICKDATARLRKALVEQPAEPEEEEIVRE